MCINIYKKTVTEKMDSKRLRNHLKRGSCQVGLIEASSITTEKRRDPGKAGSIS